MPLHHYLPATYLAEFSPDNVSRPRRYRHLFVGDMKEGRVFCASAANVAAINNLYTLVQPTDNPELIEQIWAGFEMKLADAIDLLITGNLDAKSWIRILVPFVAAMLVRGPDFNNRFEHRLRALGFNLHEELLSEDNTNGGRLLELQRLLGPIAVAKWTVVHVIGQEPLITNDLGYAPYMNIVTGDKGISIPLSPIYSLSISPRTQRDILIAQSDNWIPIIEYVQNLPNNHEGLNRALASNAQRFIFGPDETTVEKYLGARNLINCPLEPEQLGFINNPQARAHEFTWHRLACAIEQNPAGEEAWKFDLNWNLIAKGWAPMVFFPVNLIEFPPALKRKKDVIVAEFYDPEVYYSLSMIRELEQMGEFDLLLEEAEIGLQLSVDMEHKVQFLIAIGSAYDEKMEYDAALNAYEEALLIDPSSSIVIANKGVTHNNVGDVEKALISFNQALDIDPGLSQARVNRGIILINIGECSAGIDDLTEALKSIPSGPARAAALLSRGKANQILELFVDAIQDFDKAYFEYQDPLPKSYCLFYQAIAQMNTVDPSSALNSINSAIDHYWKAPEFFLLKAEILLEDGDIEKAGGAIAKALQLNLSDDKAAVAHDYLARIYVIKEDIPKALSEHNIAISLDPEGSSMHSNRGLTLLFLGDFDRAIKDFTRAMELDECNYSAMNNRGISRSAQGDYDGSISDHESIINECKDFSDIGSSLRHLAMCNLIIDDMDKAELFAKMAMTKEPDSPHNLLIEGLIYLHQGMFCEAFKSISSSSEKQKRIPEINIYLSLPIICSGEVEKGINLAKDCWVMLTYIITKYEFRNQVQALKDRFPDQPGLDQLLVFCNDFEV